MSSDTETGHRGRPRWSWWTPRSGSTTPGGAPRDNPDADAHIAALVEGLRRGRPAGRLRAARLGGPESPLHPDSPTTLKPTWRPEPDLLVRKTVNPAHGSPTSTPGCGRGITGIVVAGITTNHCCETTARVGGNLGYDVRFTLDATHTFDRTGPDGTTMSAAERTARATATNLPGEFATVVTTADVLASLR